MPATATVTAPNGDRWTVTYLPSKQRERTGLNTGRVSGADVSRYVRGILSTYGDGDTVECAACGAVCGIGRSVRATLSDGRTTWLPVAEADRAVADLPGWTVDSVSGQAPYARATIVPACPPCNGDADARHAGRERLAHAARCALDAHAERV